MNQVEIKGFNEIIERVDIPKHIYYSNPNIICLIGQTKKLVIEASGDGQTSMIFDIADNNLNELIGFQVISYTFDEFKDETDEHKTDEVLIAKWSSKVTNFNPKEDYISEFLLTLYLKNLAGDEKITYIKLIHINSSGCYYCGYLDLFVYDIDKNIKTESCTQYPYLSFIPY